MSLLFETILVKNGLPYFLDWHEARMNQSRKDLLYSRNKIKLKAVDLIGTKLDNKVYKLRISYSKEIEKIELFPYQRKEIITLKKVFCDEINYTYKYEDRSKIKDLLAKKNGCDDIIIIKQGLVTDTSFSNLAFYDGSTWVVSSQYLLNGTRRQRLILEGKVKVKDIRADDINHYEKCSLINSMLDLEETSLMCANIL